MSITYLEAIREAQSLALEKYDDVFHNTKEVEKFIKIPTLGFIPFFNFKSNIASDEDKDNDFITISNLLETEKMPKGMKFIFEETFRNIYTFAHIIFGRCNQFNISCIFSGFNQKIASLVQYVRL